MVCVHQEMAVWKDILKHDCDHKSLIILPNKIEAQQFQSFVTQKVNAMRRQSSKPLVNVVTKQQYHKHQTIYDTKYCMIIQVLPCSICKK